MLAPLRRVDPCGPVLQADLLGLADGRALMVRLAGHARERGLQRLCGEVLDHNHRMLALMESLGARLRPLRGGIGIVRAEFDLAA